MEDSKTESVFVRIAKELYEFLKQTVLLFISDNCIQKAASLAFYAMFSIVPAFLMALNIAGIVIGNTRAETELINRFEYLMNPESAQYVLTLLQSFSEQIRNKSVSVIAVTGALISGTAVFVELQSSLNVMWGIPPDVVQRSGVWSLIWSRLISFVFVVGIGMALLMAVIASSVLSAVGHFASEKLYIPMELLSLVGVIVQFGMAPILLALTYKLIPDRDIEWKDVFVGALVTAVLFALGKSLFGRYLTSTVLQSVYGAAGSLFVLLVWIYYSAQVFYFGAELTKTYAVRYGSWKRQNMTMPPFAQPK